MSRIAVLALLAVSCAEQPADLAELESESSNVQGSSYQGSSYQGSSYQGSSYQGSSYQGSSYQGSSFGGTALSTGSVNKTTLEIWRKLLGGRYEQRTPTQKCIWDSELVESTCTTYNLSTQVSPLGGAKFHSRFKDPETGTIRTGYVRIKAAVGAVSRDNWLAMHPLDGAGATGTWIAENGLSCTNPKGCRYNSDLWLYDVELVDSDGKAVPFCGNRGKAFALKGTWSENGTYSSSNASLTFACTSGTIAKCMRWGYRPFGNAKKSNGSSVPMASYHQACIRAAMADYCATGYSFTKDNTLVDVYDYQPHQTGAAGFIPRTQSLEPSATMYQWESTFDIHGATYLDFMRYEADTELGHVIDQCPGKFSLATAPHPDYPHRPYDRISPENSTDPARVWIENTGVCSHSELTLGKYLHPECSSCTRTLWEKIETIHPDHRYCISASGRWDDECVLLAQAYCTSTSRMTKHSECGIGTPLGKHATACTYRVCEQNSTCCNSNWTQDCVDLANELCSGGQENGFRGFCGAPIDLVFDGG